MKPRVLLYCHNVLGFGHIVRSMRIASQLAGRAEVRLITGCRFLEHLRVPPEVEVVLLPALRAEADGRLSAVDGGFLGSALRKRGKIIAEQVRHWKPHVLLVDHNPLGLMGELVETLDGVRKEGLQTRLVWGIRDIWSSPEYLRNMLAQYAGDPEAMKRRLLQYHSAIAYTDETWLQTLEHYDRGLLPARTASVGFVTEPVPASQPVHGAPLVTVLSGGGEGAERLTSLVLEAVRDEPFRLRFVVGPFASADAVRAQTEHDPGIEVWPEGTVEEAIADASLVVSRTGYNTAYTVVQSDLPVTFVPLSGGNEEQAMRAARLAELDRVESIDDRDENAAKRLRESIRRGLASERRARQLPFSTEGAQRAAEWILTAAAEVDA
ncbi:MAG: glycosyltransferase [Acidobacteriota bacterium]